MKKLSKLIIVIAVCMLTFITRAQAAPIKPNVTRISGYDCFQTSIAVAQQGYKDQKLQNVLLASGYNFSDALTASPLAMKLNAPILLVGYSVSESQETLDYIKGNMAIGGTVTIIGGTVVVPEQIEQWLIDSGCNVVRLGGFDKFKTNSLIVENLNLSKGTPVVIASGDDFPDALGIASVAAGKGWPILLSGSTCLPDSAKAFIAAKQPSDAYIVGGTAVLTDSVVGDLHKASPSTKITRFAGHDRFDTLAKVVTTFCPNPTEIYIANGYNFADTLSGSVQAAKSNAPILLIDHKSNVLPPAIRQYLLNHYDPKVIPQIKVLGGTTAVPELAVEFVNACIGNSTMLYPEPKPIPRIPEIPEIPEIPAPLAEIMAEKQLMLDLINQERSKVGVGPLSFDDKLQAMAQAKTDDIVANNYFDHTSPTYGSPFDMMEAFGISFRAAGENIAGNSTVEAAHVALMNSPGHKENILNPSFRHIGIGITEGGLYKKMFSQEFTD